MVSRICIKNLPKDIEKQKVASHFKDFGPFTDVKLMRTEFVKRLNRRSREVFLGMVLREDLLSLDLSILPTVLQRFSISIKPLLEPIELSLR